MVGAVWARSVWVMSLWKRGLLTWCWAFLSFFFFCCYIFHIFFYYIFFSLLLFLFFRISFFFLLLYQIVFAFKKSFYICRIERKKKTEFLKFSLYSHEYILAWPSRHQCLGIPQRWRNV
jgi:hypothetical protein